MVTNDNGDVGVRFHLGKDALADLGVTLHLAELLQGKSPFLVQECGGKPDLPNIVYKARKIGSFNLLRGQTEFLGDISGIGGYRSRVTCRVTIALLKRLNERRCE